MERLMPTEDIDNDHFSRFYPFRHFAKRNQPAHEVLATIANGLKTGEIQGHEVKEFLASHKLVFFNTNTQMASDKWSEQPDSTERAYFHCYSTCSCECGPLDEPCNEQGPGSKVRFSFRKEEISR